MYVLYYVGRMCPQCCKALEDLRRLALRKGSAMLLRLSGKEINGQMYSLESRVLVLVQEQEVYS